MALDDIWLDRRQRINTAFTPSAPVNDRELFAGRTDELVQLLDAVGGRGQHAIVYGERGVGKTSLASIAEIISRIRGYLVARVNLDQSDNFASIWPKVVDDLNRNTERGLFQLDALEIEQAVDNASAFLLDPDASSGSVLSGLHGLVDTAATVLFLDEFDRLNDAVARTQLVDLVKALSDHSVQCTLILVGVAEDVDDLIEDHESIGRALVQIRMPRMSADELSQIIERGLEQADMHIEEDAKRLVTGLSIGLPHYTHLLAQQSAFVALAQSVLLVQRGHVMEAIPQAVARAQQRVVNLYHRATHSTQQNIYPEVLLACALSRTDDRGFFAPGNVRDPLERVMGTRYEIPAFARHLTAFGAERGPVLEKTEGPGRRPRYRFIEPLLVPYVLMRGLERGLVTENDFGQIDA